MGDYSRFSSMPISDSTKAAIRRMGFDTPTPIQSLVLPHALKHQDLLGQAQTGTGKTLAFAIPIVENAVAERKEVQAIVLTPTRELALQVFHELEKVSHGSGIDAVAIYGGASQRSQEAGLRKGAQVVVGTPGRIMDLMRQGILLLNKVSIAVLDEVDEMLNMGFVDDVETIFAKLPKRRQNMFFSATIPPRVQRLGRTYLRRPVILSTSDDNVLVDTTEHSFYEVEDRKRVNALCDVIDVEDVSLGLIFCKTKREADKVYDALRERGYVVEALHGDMPQSRREKVMLRYRAGELQLLVATNVAARGIDVSGVSHVFNYRLPEDADTYVHRTGRTGRAGASGKSISLVSPGEYYELLRIQEEHSLWITCLSLPDPAQLEEKRMKRMLDEIKRGLENEDVSEIYALVKKEIPFFWRGRALAYVLKKYKDAGHTFLGKGKSMPSGKKGGGSDYKRLYLNLGKIHKLDEKGVSKILVKQGQVPETSIQKIDLFDKYSFINVDSDQSEKLIEQLSGKKISGHNVRIEESRSRGGRDSRRSSGPRPRSSRTRSGGGRPPRH